MQDVAPGMMRLQQIKAQMGGIQGTQEAVELQNTLQAYAAEELVMLRQAVAVFGEVPAFLRRDDRADRPDPRR